MKKLLFTILFFALLILLVPYCAVLLFSPPSPQSSSAIEAPRKITAYSTESDSVSEIDFEQYLKGVVAAEMPASFCDEALKAQAVAARSYILRRMQVYERDGAPEEHKGAMTCDNPSHCKAYLSDSSLRAQWGGEYDNYMKKISDCVAATSGIIMTCDGEIVNAVFHSTSSGSTENAKDVWGGDVSYLVSVKSEGDELSPRFDSETVVGREEFKGKISAAHSNAHWNDGQELIDDIVRSDAGGIISLCAGGVKLKGTELRELFSLRSANVEFSYDNDSVIMRTKGNGHGVGMSQYGANYLASTGMDYESILKTYYTGVELEKYSPI